MPGEGYSLIEKQVREVVSGPHPGLWSTGLLLTLWGSSRAADALRVGLNHAHAVKETRPWWKRQLLALAVTLSAIALMALCLVLMRLGREATRDAEGLRIVWVVVRWLFGGVAVCIALSLCYGLVPDVPVKVRVFSRGAVLATLAWGLSTLAFSQYVQHFDRYNVAYGSIGGIMVLLTWLYFSGVIVLIGAEIDALREPRKTNKQA